MSKIKLQGIDIDGNQKEYSLEDFKGKKLFYIFIQKIILPVVHKKHATLEIILTD